MRVHASLFACLCGHQLLFCSPPFAPLSSFLTQNGTGGIVLVAPSTGKRWLTTPTAASAAAPPIPDDLLQAIAVPTHPAVDARLQFDDGAAITVRGCRWLLSMEFFKAALSGRWQSAAKPAGAAAAAAAAAVAGVAGAAKPEEADASGLAAAVASLSIASSGGGGAGAGAGAEVEAAPEGDEGDLPLLRVPGDLATFSELQCFLNNGELAGALEPTDALRERLSALAG